MIAKAESPHDVAEELMERLGLPEEEREGYRVRIGGALLTFAVDIHRAAEEALAENRRLKKRLWRAEAALVALAVPFGLLALYAVGSSHYAPAVVAAFLGRLCGLLGGVAL